MDDMPWWGWALTIIVAGLLLTAGLLALWVRKEWLAIPPDERRTWPEIRKELPGFWPALRDTWRQARADLAEHLETRRRMQQRSEEARRAIYREQYEKTRQEIRDHEGQRRYG